MAERWRPIEGYEGMYEVSSEGRVRSLPRTERFVREGWIEISRPRKGRVLSGCLVDGYRRVLLHKDGRPRKRMVHQLVLNAFMGPCPQGREADHINTDRTDNRLANLRWVTRKANAEHRVALGRQVRGTANGNSRLSEAQVLEMRGLYASGEAKARLARRYSVSESQVRRVVTGKAWAHLPLQPPPPPEHPDD